MLFTLPMSILESQRPRPKQIAIASGHWHSVKIACGQVNHHNSLFTFLDVHFALLMPGVHTRHPEGWDYAEYFELRGSWSVIVQPVSLGGE